MVSEKGKLALVMAAPDQFTELARFPAIKSKTWNHPVLVGDGLGSQQPGDGSVPAVPRWRLTGVAFAAIDMIIVSYQVVKAKDLRLQNLKGTIMIHANLNRT